MKITPKIKVLLVISLVLTMIASYFINKLGGQEEANNKAVEVTKETIDEYNERKRIEIAERRKEEEERLRNKKPESNDPDYRRKLTIDGYDPVTKNIIDPINLWANYKTRTYAGNVRHGEIVTLIRREGDGVFIQKESGQRGWVTYFFIKEFNDEAKKRGDK